MSEDPGPNRVLRTRRRVIAGVAGGFGRYFAIDPNVVRIVLVLLAFAGGIGILLYLAAWLIVPEEPLDAQHADVGGPAQPRSNLLAILLVGLLAIVAVATIGRRTFDVAPGIVWALALIGGGAAVLWLRAPDARAATGAPYRPAPPAAHPPVPTFPSPSAPAAADAPSAPWTVTRVTPSPLQRVAPVLGRIALVILATVAALVIAAAGVLLVEGPGSVNVTPLEAIVTGALVVLVVAVTLVFGIGRGWLPEVAPVALALLAVLALAGWIGPPFRGGFGVRQVKPDALISRESVYRLAGGRLTIDLRDTRLAERAQVLSTSVATGSVDVLVPRHVNVDLRARVDAGGIKSFGVDEGGVKIDRHAVDRVPGATRTLHVRARVGFGEIVVRRDTGRASSVPAQEAVA